MDNLAPTKTTDKSISSIRSLSKALGIAPNLLLSILEIPPESRYKEIQIPKDSGGKRDVYDAIPLLRQIQHKINIRIFKKLIKWPPYLYGSIPNDFVGLHALSGSVIRRDYIACAQRHCESKSILKLDISNFFENIHRTVVEEIFSNFFKFPKEVSNYLTEVCCLGNNIVQGALTSSYIASLCLWDVEHKVVAILTRRNLTYTRLVDDITVSSKLKGYDFSNAETHIRNMMIEKDFPLNASKTMVMRAGSAPLSVHGLIVDFKTPRLPSSEVSRIRASVHNAVRISSVDNFRTSYTYRNQFYRCLGRVNKLARVGHNKHKGLVKKLMDVRPLPNSHDIAKVNYALTRLRNHSDKSSDSYRRIYNITLYRITVIARTFLHESLLLKSQLETLVKPKPKPK